MAIETAEAISAEVATIVQDSSFDVDDTISFINKGIKEIAGRVLLPKLEETETTVDTVVSTAYASLPNNFHRNLHYCYSNTHTRKVKIYGSLRLLYRQFSQLDLTGRVMGVARRGEQLYYQRIPSSAETLRIHYYKYPTALTVQGNSPDCLPEFLVRPLMVNYVAKEIWTLKEDGENDPKTNTKYYEGKYLEALGDLISYIGPEAREPQEIVEEIDYEDYL